MERYLTAKLFWTACLGLCICLLFALPAFPGDRIVVAAIKSRDIAPYNEVLAAFEKSLKKQNAGIEIVEFSLTGSDETGSARLAAQVAGQKPSLILSIGTPATKLAREQLGSVPVVFALVLAPKANGFAPPGVSMDIPAIAKLKALARIFPQGTRFGTIYSPESVAAQLELADACRLVGFQLKSRKINSEKEFPEAFARLSQETNVFIMIPDTTIYFQKSVEHLLREGLRRGIPIVGLSSHFTKAGSLISFDVDFEDIGEQAGQIAARILNGKTALTTEIGAPGKLRISLNLMVADQLGIRIPRKVINEADEVFGK